MLKYYYVFRGEVASKKNGKQLVHVKGRSVLLPSKQYRAWEKSVRAVISIYGRPPEPFAAARIVIRIFHGDAVKRDTNNATQGIQDVLVDMGVIADDNWMVIGSPEVSHFIDVGDPRMEVDVYEQEPVDYAAIFKQARKDFKSSLRLQRDRSAGRARNGRKGCQSSCGASAPAPSSG